MTLKRFPLFSPRFARIHCFNVDTEGNEKISKYFNASYAALFLEKIASAILSVMTLKRFPLFFQFHFSSGLN